MSLTVQLQKFGRALSAMIMPNIGAFIAWGLITALFIPTGWLPNEYWEQLVGPMIKYMLPLLIGYAGGVLIYGVRGGVLGAIATMGVVVGSEIPMFIGAMAMGPFAAFCVKLFDQRVGKHAPAGFEMLVNNFSAGIIGMFLAMLGYGVIGGVITSVSSALGIGAEWLVENSLLPLIALLVEPAKVLFLNNAINHGVFTPLGTQQIAEAQKSLYFLIEANPGPGLGLLLAYALFGKGMARQSSPGAMLIHFFGGIHEVYFPYVLMRPLLIVAMMAGGVVSVTTLMITGAGLVAPASPGSIFAVFAVTAKDSYFGVLLAVVLSAATSFFVASVILKAGKQEGGNLEEMTRKSQAMKAESKGQGVSGAPVSLIAVACDAGMGSSAMGATMLRKKVNQAGLSIEVKNLAINDLTGKEDIIITHSDLTQRAKTVSPRARHLSIGNFMDRNFYDDLVRELAENG